MKSLSATILLSLVLSFSAQAAIDSDKVNELKKEKATESGGSKVGANSKKLETLYGTVFIAMRGEVQVRVDNQSGVYGVKLIDAGLTPSDVSNFPRGSRVKISREDDGTRGPFTSIVKVAGEEAQIKILNRSDCLQRYGTDGATECFKKFPQ